MGATIVMDEMSLATAPGAEAVVEVRIRNDGEVVDQFTVDVVGTPKEWATVEPALVNLLPGDDAYVEVTFRPPRSSDVPAGITPYGVRVRSREDPHASTVEQGEIDVQPFVELAAELVPVTRRGKRRARYTLAVDNTGNTEQHVELSGLDPADQLDLELAESSLLTEPGTATMIRLTVRPHRRFWRGEEKTLPFQLLVQAPDDPADIEPLTIDGVMIQGPLQPKWLLKAAALTVAAVAALLIAWFTLLKPTVESVAREQAAEKAEAATKRANQAADRADEAAEKADPGGGAAGGDEKAGGGAGGKDDPKAGTPGGTAGVSDPAGAAGGVTSATSFRIQADAAPVRTGEFTTFSYTAPDNRAVQIADLVLQNPRGDAGFVRIVLDGEVVLEVGLANFRDLDYHYVVPLHLNPKKSLGFQVNCEQPGSNAPRCSPAVSLSGRLVAPERRAAGAG